MLQFIGLTSSYLETAIDGLIAGLAGYVGTVLMTWIIKNAVKPAWNWLKKKVKRTKKIK